MRFRIPAWVDFAAAIVAVIAAIALLVAGCGSRRADVPVPVPAEEPAPPQAKVEDARETVDQLREKLAAAESRERTEKARAEQIEREQAERERRAVVATQVKWGTRLAGLAFLAGTLLAIASFWWPIPKRWGFLGAASGLGLLVAARAWALAGEHVLVAAIALLGAGALVLVWMLTKSARATALAAKFGDAMERAETDADAVKVKLDAGADQAKAKVRGWIQRARGR